MEAEGPILVLGDINVDALMPIDSYPPPGGDKRSERTVIEAGGSAANAAIQLARCGLSVEMVGCVGQDVLAELALDALRQAGVGVEHVQRVEGETTGLMFVPVTPDGQRTLFGRRGANLQLAAAELPQGRLQSARALHMSGYAFLGGPQAAAAQAALNLAQDADAFLSMDTAYEPPMVATEALRSTISFLDLLVLGEEEAETLAAKKGLDESGSELLRLGAARVAVKRGRQGCALYEGDEIWLLPILPVETVDSTGAGDSFAGALLFGLLSGMSMPAAGALATAAGALATTDWGAGGRAPSLGRILALLEESAPHGDPTFDEATERALVALRGG